MEPPKNSLTSSQSLTSLLLEILQEAGLLSASQIEVVRQDQKIFPHLDLEEILVLRGWIHAQTVEFFLHKWSEELKQRIKRPLGYYLEEAGLLCSEQVSEILQSQKQSQHWIRFGELVVNRGWLKPKTLDFFLKNLFKPTSKSPNISVPKSCGLLREYIRGKTDFSGSNFNQVKLKGVFLKGINLQDSQIRAADLEQIHLNNSLLTGVDFSQSNLQQAYLQNANLKQANLKEVNLKDAHLNEADLSEANLRGANLENAYLIKACLQGANLKEAHLKDTYLYGAYYDQRTSFESNFDPVQAGMVFRADS